MRILLVEDGMCLAENIAEALREITDFAVDCAVDSRKACIWRSRCYDLIISDLMLPLLDGQTVLSKLRPDRDRTPVLILTASGEETSANWWRGPKR